MKGRQVTQAVSQQNVKAVVLGKDTSSQEEPEEDESAPQILEELDSYEMAEVLDFMESDKPFVIKHDHLEEDEKFHETQEPFKHPERVVTRVKRLKPEVVKSFEDEVEEEVEETRKSRWLITICCYCGQIFRFRSDQPQPLTCEKLQCITRLEEHRKKKAAALAKIGSK